MSVEGQLRRRVAELADRVAELEKDIDAVREIYKVERTDGQTLLQVVERMVQVAKHRSRIDELRHCFDSGVISAVNYLRDHGYKVANPVLRDLEGRP